MTAQAINTHPIACSLRVRGLVQGVGFRPTVWRIANSLGLEGDVCNDGSGVLINLSGMQAVIDSFAEQLLTECPPLARIDSIETLAPESRTLAKPGFHIIDSHNSNIHTGVVADAATCDACLQDIFAPDNRRYRYPYTNCTHCGPRFSIVRKIPYDRANTSMSSFDLCNDCADEYADPSDRRFHAQPTACPSCGPQTWLSNAQGEHVDCEDPIKEAAAKIRTGAIVAIKGIGGMHLACDATNSEAIDTLRKRKHRPHKPLAMMGRTLQQISHYCRLDTSEISALKSPAAPVVLLSAIDTDQLPLSISPGQKHWGFMLPYTPLHHLLMAELDTPIVLTSGNLSEEPQCTDNEDATRRLDDIADFMLLNDRPIINRIDDSVVRIVSDDIQIMRRARGYAPATIPLPAGFESADALLALGGELKNTFCLISNGQAILSQHMGDLEDARTLADYKKNLELYQSLYEFNPKHLVIDAHPEYVSSKLGRSWSEEKSLDLSVVQHHHAHIASCLGDNNIPLDHPPIIGIALDGLGMGSDNTLWGGEVLLANYQHCQHLATLKPVPLIGGAQAMREPWRNTYAHLKSAGLWDELVINHPELQLVQQLQKQALGTVDVMLQRKLNCPPCSSAGRLFDAVAGALDMSPTQSSFEGQAAMALEALVDEQQLENHLAYDFGLHRKNNLLEIDPTLMWQQLLDDLVSGTDSAAISTRFHRGLANALSNLAIELCQAHNCQTIALSGGVYQNKVLFKLTQQALQKKNLKVLSHHQVPANDGGLSLGQALIAAARQPTRR